MALEGRGEGIFVDAIYLTKVRRIVKQSNDVVVNPNGLSVTMANPFVRGSMTWMTQPAWTLLLLETRRTVFVVVK